MAGGSGLRRAEGFGRECGTRGGEARGTGAGGDRYPDARHERGDGNRRVEAGASRGSGHRDLMPFRLRARDGRKCRNRPRGGRDPGLLE